MKMKQKSILITGGTGSFGKEFIKSIIDKHEYNRIVIYSRDEFKQYHMENEFPKSKYPHLRFFIGDVRDKDRLKRACSGINIIVHAAAMKHVPIAEYNPDEFIKTNIIGAQNVVDVALSTESVKAVVALSTDKAAAPINLYGATKLVSDKLFVSANNVKGSKDIKFSVVRYGNVLCSRGSVIPFFIKKSKSGVIPLTHKDMTRFNMLLSDAVDMVSWVIEMSDGGEIFVPKLKSFKLTTLANAISKTSKHEIVGLRPGEKIHEEMITTSDSYYTVDLGKFYAILPPDKDMNSYIKKFNGSKVEPGFSYNSLTNPDVLGEPELKHMIKMEFNG
jgi:UDP-N-acetylglucosamine 4,6-dehydratase